MELVEESTQKMLTGDPIQDDVQWLLQELKQVDQDIEIVRKYHEFVLRGNTVSVRYDVIDEHTISTQNLEKQMHTLSEARENILHELECLDETYLETHDS
jgi:hypothetical protein